VDRTPGVRACRKTGISSGYGGYPAADCELFRRTTGLQTKEKASKGHIEVACQRDLRKANRDYRPGQTNTWWVWTTSDSGTWDWFPETAVVEGASDEPIGNVAVCR
jgi:hypothetical protein